ncbi:MAG: hypothetical protein KJN68_09320 [Bacteroidia bacterium]|nr:hypothetical protein [Bacteroidia bacterium]
MTELISLKRRLLSILLAWLIFIGIDFLFHASLFSAFWNEEIPALKPLNDLAILIPAGYLSFLLLTSLVGFVFFRVFRSEPPLRKVFYFGFVFALLFSLSNLSGLYSYIDLPIKQLVVFNFVYFVEILAVSFSLYYFSFRQSLKKSTFYAVLIFFVLVVVGIIIQNIYSFS